jgi:hypothetical protein
MSHYLLGLALLLASLFASKSAMACPVQVFCSGWNAVCQRTGGLPEVCSARRSQCLKTGCYHFNNPGPRCRSNPQDIALTTACRGLR